MKKIILLLLLVTPLLIQAQDSGIHFLHEASWKEIRAKAKAENKYIFMDCYTTWCGPCKYMSASIFPLKNVGDFMNEKFISVKVQLDTTAKDNDEVKSWYQDGHDLAKKYNIKAYPTYLIFDANGKAVHRFIGSGTADVFLAAVKKSFNPETQYYTLLNQYKNGKRNKEFLLNMANASADVYDMVNANKIFNEYLATQTDLYTKENLDIIKQFTQSSADKGFGMMMHHPDKVDAVLGKGTSASITESIIMREEVFKNFPKDPKATPDWAKMKSNVSKKYLAQAPQVMAKSKIMWYQHTSDWNNYQQAILDYMSKYGAAVSPDELNNYAWSVFQNCPDMKCVTQALEWSKRSFENNNKPGFIDTYANLLYRLGKKDEAIQWEQKAMDFAQGDDKAGYQKVIDKMNKNEKTWN